MKLSKILVASVMITGGGLAVANAESLLGEVDVELSTGYDSHYIFRGINLGEDAVWTGLELSAPVVDGIDLTLGTWYINPTSGGIDNDELDLYASLGTSVGVLDVAVSYFAYLYPERGSGETQEIIIELGTEILGVSVGGLYGYDFDLETHYFEGIVGYAVDLGDIISAEFSACVGFLEDEYQHTMVRLALPVALTDNATLTPYIAGTFPDENIRGGTGIEDDEFFGGASLSVTF